MHADGTDIEQNRTDALVAAYRRDEPGADDRLCTLMRPVVARAVAYFLTDDSPDLDDVVQETLLAALGYLRRDVEFSGDFMRLAVTIANNRCRDILRSRQRKPQVQIDTLADWIADDTRSPLDDMQENEMYTLLQRALDGLGRECLDLLRDLYLEALSAEEVRRRIGLSTVQGVYYRKAICLEEARKFLNRRLSIRSWFGS
ncbi:sigma-70 family RNA polymerase sigma factor [bacterium]|nr:sigma-70 family RNA polymerase sigma factor [bacterium]